MNYTHLRIGILLALATIVTPHLYAVPAKPGTFERLQPDGSRLTLQLVGDEHWHAYLSQDGALLLKDSEGLFRYAELRDGRLGPSDLKAHDIAQRDEREAIRVRQLIESRDEMLRLSRASHETAQQAPAKVAAESPAKAPSRPEGDLKGLVLLVQTNDLLFQAENTREAFDRHVNATDYKDEGGMGSVRDYFIAQSDGIFRPSFDVFGPYTLAHEMSFYGKDSESSHDMNMNTLVYEAVTMANADVNYKNYDNNGDGIVDFLYIVYAGPSQAEGAGEDYIWPHKSSVAGVPKMDGVYVSTYACGNEVNGQGRMGGIGTICHEFSHVIGLRDMYDTRGNLPGMLSWSIMSSGSYLNDSRTPCGYLAEEKAELGWIQLEEVTKECDLTLETLSRGGRAYRLTNPNNDQEYFILENKQRIGWDEYLPAHGLLVMHVDYDAKVWRENTINTAMPQRATVVPADNVVSNATSNGDTYPGTTSNTSLTDFSTPAARCNDGGFLSKPVTDIQETDGVITLSVLKGSQIKPVSKRVSALTAYSARANWESVSGADRYAVELYRIDGTVDESQLNYDLIKQQGRLVADAVSTGTSYKFINLEEKTWYAYWVRCTVDGVPSLYSDLVFFQTPKNTTGLPSPEPEVYVTAADEVYLSWEAVPTATAYWVEVVKADDSDNGEQADGSLILAEKFDNLSSAAGAIDRVTDIYTQVPDWKANCLYADQQCVVLGNETETGYLVTPMLGHESGVVTVYFSVRKVDEKDANPVLAIGLGTDADPQYYVEFLGAEVPDVQPLTYYAVLGPLDTNPYIAFMSYKDTGRSNRLIIDDIEVYWGDTEGRGIQAFGSVSAKRAPQDTVYVTQKYNYYTTTETNLRLQRLQVGDYAVRVRCQSGDAYSPYSESMAFRADVPGFEVEGVRYQVLSEEAHTVRVSGVPAEMDCLAIPSVVNYKGMDYVVSALADSLCRGHYDLISASLPESLSEVGVNAFKGCRNLCYVTCEAPVTFPADCFSGANPQLLFYAGENTRVQDNIHVVRDGRLTKTLTLTLNSPFFAPEAFTADTIQLIKNHSQTTKVGTSGGWETLWLPFDVQEMRYGEKPIAPFANSSAKTHFWLAEFENDTFKEATEIKANTPYIVAYPNAQDYAEADRISGGITYRSVNAEVHPTSELRTIEGRQYAYVPVWKKIYAGEKVNALNAYDNMVEGCLAGSVFVADRMSVRNLNAYLTPIGAPVQYIPVRFGDEEDEGPAQCTILYDKGRVNVYCSKTLQADVYGLDGRCVRRLDLMEGENLVEGLAPGVYLLLNQKIIVR